MSNRAAAHRHWLSRTLGATALLCVAMVSAVPADLFVHGISGYSFELNFVPISSATNPTQQQADQVAAGDGIVPYDYRMGMYEIKQSDWAVYLGNDPSGVTNPNRPKGSISWFDAARFINWLNTSTGHHEAYDVSDTSIQQWGSNDRWSDDNPWRHKDAFYFLPSVDEWVKAGYWNGTDLQTYANRSATDLNEAGHPKKGAGVGWNYGLSPSGPWDVGSGIEELNGTFDLMGNVYNWNETLVGAGPNRSNRFFLGGCYGDGSEPKYLSASQRRGDKMPTDTSAAIGLRVASVSVPEPRSVIMLLAGAAGILLWRRRNARALGKP